MKKRKIVMYIAIILLVLFIIFIGFLVIKNRQKRINEYIPEQEITEEQLRQTNILLYFYNKEKNVLEEEIRQIDAKELIENPERKLIELLMSEPQKTELSKLIPENTQLISTELIRGILYVNFSKEFRQEKQPEINSEKNIVESIIKTVSQLTEISEIKILIEGEEIIIK